MDPDESGWVKPGPKITRSLFRKWQVARRGEQHAEDLSNPVWEWLFQGRIDPFRANQHFRSLTQRLLNIVNFPEQPRWAGCRFGQSQTELSDGRRIWIGGEHEDFYDPDFFIYNDVIIQHPEDRIEIRGYPVADFPPTDFHSATLTPDESAILLIGNLGYPDDRRDGETQVLRLDTNNLHVQRVATSGKSPGWIGNHSATLDETSGQITISGGKVWTGDDLIRNIDDWSLEINSGRWRRLTERNWPQFSIAREDQEPLHLWQYKMSSLGDESDFAIAQRKELTKSLGAEPDFPQFQTLFQPRVDFTPVTSMMDDFADEESEDEDDWSTTKVMIEGVLVSFVDNMHDIRMTVEGQLPESLVESLAEELCGKLSRVEHAPCVVKRLQH